MKSVNFENVAPPPGGNGGTYIPTAPGGGGGGCSSSSSPRKPDPDRITLDSENGIVTFYYSRRSNIGAESWTETFERKKG